MNMINKPIQKPLSSRGEINATLPVWFVSILVILIVGFLIFSYFTGTVITYKDQHIGIARPTPIGPVPQWDPRKYWTFDHAVTDLDLVDKYYNGAMTNGTFEVCWAGNRGVDFEFIQIDDRIIKIPHRNETNCREFNEVKSIKINHSNTSGNPIPWAGGYIRRKN